MASQDRKRHCRVMTQRRILPPVSQECGAARDKNNARHSDEQDRRTKARNMRHGPLEDNPACASGFVFARLQQAKCCGREEYSCGWYQQPLADSKDWQSENPGSLIV